MDADIRQRMEHSIGPYRLQDQAEEQSVCMQLNTPEKSTEVGEPPTPRESLLGRGRVRLATDEHRANFAPYGTSDSRRGSNRNINKQRTIKIFCLVEELCLCPIYTILIGSVNRNRA